jgi:hypothetical protein
MVMRIKIALLFAAFITSAPATAFAYVGPGAGLTMFGSAVALIMVIFIVLLGLILWPIRAIQRRKRMGNRDSEKK